MAGAGASTHQLKTSKPLKPGQKPDKTSDAKFDVATSTVLGSLQGTKKVTSTLRGYHKGLGLRV